MNTTMAQATDPRIAELLERLHDTGSFSYLWTVDSKANKRSYWYAIDDGLPVIGARLHTYFGVHPTSEIPDTDAKGNKRQSRNVRSRIPIIELINCLYAEYDAKDFGAEDRANGKLLAMDHIDALKVQPSVIIDSGGGYHCYWILDEPTVLDTPESTEHARSLQKRWVEFVGGDKGAADLTRVLRLPGTYNWKYTPEPEVVFVRYDIGLEFDLESLENCMPEPPPVPESIVSAEVSRAYGSAALKGQCVDLSRATGSRNVMLNNAAFRIGSLIAAGALDEQEARAALRQACVTNGLTADDGIAATNATIDSGIAAGKKAPAMITAKAPTDAPKIYFVAQTVDDVLAAPDKPWMIENFIGEEDLVMLWGPSESGKTFLALHLCLLLARGSGTMTGDFKVNGPRSVVYMTQEGRSGLRQRFHAAVTDFALTPEEKARIRVCTRVVQFLLPDRPNYYQQFLDDFEAQGFKPDLIVIDHLSSTLPGKGDSDQGAATDVATCVADIQEKTGAAVLLIHHAGYNTKHSRGMTNYKDVLDQQIKVEASTATSGNPRTLTCTKNKDGKRWQAQMFDLVEVEGTKSVTLRWNGVIATKGDNIISQQLAILSIVRDSPGCNQAHIISKMKQLSGVGPSAVKSRIASLIEESRLAREGSEAVGYMFSLPV